MYTEKGTVKKVYPLEKISDSFQKRRVVIETDGQYKQFLEIEFAQNRVGELNNVKQGDVITVGFFLKGREYKKDGVERYFMSLDGYKVEGVPARIEDAVKLINEKIPPSDDLPF